MPGLHMTGDPAADEFLPTDPLALLIGMLLDQQVRYPCRERDSPERHQRTL